MIVIREISMYIDDGIGRLFVRLLVIDKFSGNLYVI